MTRIATLEAFIIDTFARVQGGELVRDKPEQIGGAGTYAIIGARIFLPAHRLCMVVDYTPSTLPAAMRGTLEAYGDMWIFRERADATTRAINTYDGETRQFAYLTPPRLLYPSDLPAAPGWVHLCSYPERAVRCLAELEHKQWGSRLLWEPEPPGCIPENLDIIAAIAAKVDIISPNHLEAATLFRAAGSDRAAIEWCIRRLVACRPRLAAVVRAGPLGACFALSADLREEVDVHLPFPPSVPVYWVPAYHARAVDPTGAGNAFMGGLMAALDQGRGVHEACIWANVAASFVIEQDGLPRLQDGRWNGADPWERVRELSARVQN